MDITKMATGTTTTAGETNGTNDSEHNKDVVSSSSTEPPETPVITNAPINSPMKKTSAELVQPTKNGKVVKYALPNALDMAKLKQEAKVQKQAQHTAVISLTVKNTNKILKEIGFRRARLRVSIHKLYTHSIEIYT